MAGTNLETIAKTIAKTQPRFQAIAKAGGGYVNFETEARYAKQIILRSSALMRCEIQSIEDAVMNIASIGLSLSPALQHAALIPRRASNKKTYCCFDPMYRGLIKLATDSGSVKMIQASAVYEEEVHAGNFKMTRGTDPHVMHKVDPLMKLSMMGEIVGAYCVATMANGMQHTTWMPIDEILEIRERSEAWKAGQRGPWKTDFQEMCVKTPIKRGRKQWPIGSERLDRAIMLSNEAEGYIEPQPSDIQGEVDTGPKITELQDKELRDLCRQAHLRVARVYEKYEIQVMKMLPAKQFNDCRTNCLIAWAHHDCNANKNDKGFVVYAADYEMKLDVLEGIAANYESKVALRTEREA